MSSVRSSVRSFLLLSGFAASLALGQGVAVSRPLVAQVTPGAIIKRPQHRGWTQLTPGKTAYGLQFTPAKSLTFQGKTLLSRVPVSYSSDGVTTYAQRLIVSPTSPSGRFNIVKGCDGALCWAVFLIDRQTGKAQQIQIGKYGGLEWVKWTKDERYAVFGEKNDGAFWFNVVNLQTGETKLSEQLNPQVNLNSFTWISDRAFRVNFLNSKVPFRGDITKLFDQQ